MISREEAINKLKEYWGVEELTFLSNFELAKYKGGKLAENTFGFFENLNLYNKQLILPPFENKTNIPASCFALKGDLEEDILYMITVELSDDIKRKNKPFSFDLVSARKATEEEIVAHKSNAEPIIKEKKQKKESEKLFVAYLNFVAEDNSHAYIKVIDVLSSSVVKSAKGESGDLIKNFPDGLFRQQLIVVKRNKNKSYQFVTDIFQGYIYNDRYFINTHSFETVFYINPVIYKNQLISIESLGQPNLFLENCKIFDKKKGFEIEKIVLDEEIKLPDLFLEVKSKADLLLRKKNLDINESKLFRLFEKIDDTLSQRKENQFELDFENLEDEFDIDEFDVFIQKWCSLGPEIISISRLSSMIENINLFKDHFMELWINGKLSFDFFQEYFINLFIDFLNKNNVDLDDFLDKLTDKQKEKIKDDLVDLLDTEFIIDSVSIYLLVVDVIEKVFTGIEKFNNRQSIKKFLNEDLQYELWVSGDLVEFPVEKAIADFKNLNSEQQEQVVLRIDDEYFFELKEDEQTRLLFEIRSKANLILQKESFDTSDIRLLGLFKNIDYNLVNLQEKQYEFDIERIKNTFDIDILLLMFQKWSPLNPELIKYKKVSTIIKNLGGVDDLLIELWKKEELPSDFFEELFIKKFISYLETKKLDFDDLFNLLSSNQKEIIMNGLLEFYKTEFNIESVLKYQLFDYLNGRLVSREERSERKKILNASLINDDLKFELWTSGIINEIPIEKAILNFKNLNTFQQEEVLLLLDDDSIKPLIKHISIIKKQELSKRVYDIKLDLIFFNLNPVSFDIECKEDTIYEIAWNEGESWFNYLNNKVKEGIDRFNSIQNTNPILVGHNVTEFDLPILKRLGNISFNENKVWDTFKVEMILSPELKTFALKTKHEAEYDAKHTFKLFKNQLFRILILDIETLNPLQISLGNEIFSKILEIKNEFGLNEDLEELNENKLEFFRPQPKINSVIKRLDVHLKDSEATRKIVIGTSSMFQDLLSYGMIFFSEHQFNNIDFQRLSKEKIENKIHLDEFSKAHLLSYINLCLELDKIPYWGNVSPAIRFSLEQKNDVWSCFESEINMEYYSKFPIFLSVDQVEDYFNVHGQSIETDLFVLQPDLISISQKYLIQKLDVEQLKVLFPDNYFWLKFSGGQSVLELEDDLLKTLDFDGVESFDNYWIEKYYVGKYRIYGSKNWGKTLKKYNFKNIIRIDIDPELFFNEQVNSIKFKVNPNNKYSITRFNPESIYRSRYWVIQKKIIDQLLNRGSTVLLVLRSEEVSLLNEYFEKLGYYIPNKEISLGRRLELLHRYNSEKKIIIAHVNEGDAILKLNHTEPINLIFDSFNLLELYFCSKGTSFFNLMKNEGTAKSNELNSAKESEDEEENENSVLESTVQKGIFIKDTFFLLKLLLPKLTHIRNLLKLNNPENKLWLLDPRIEDYPELCEHWNIGKIHVNGWDSKDKFEEDVKEAELYINSPKLTTLPFSTEEEMEVIRKVFIPEYDWKPEQVPYLKNILKSKDDLLIILPTGVGKSILFHGPAILKSSFTNRMTIVVTPLKALMEDQVNKLWDLGFYGSVEYLNSERSADKEFIYRSMAGGELSLLFVTPERFRSRSFLNALESRIQNDGGLEYFVFDEAHCLSQWGQDFRPDYFNCAKHIYNTKKASDYKTPLLLFSATVSKKIYNDFNLIFS